MMNQKMKENVCIKPTNCWKKLAKKMTKRLGRRQNTTVVGNIQKSGQQLMELTGGENGE